MQPSKPTCIIVDDEPANHKVLDLYIAEDGRLKVTGRCYDAFAAMELIQAKKPQVVLLDVKMPAMTGLEMLANLPGANFSVVLYTAEHPDDLVLTDKRIKGVLPKLCGPERFSRMVGKVLRGLGLEG